MDHALRLIELALNFFAAISWPVFWGVVILLLWMHREEFLKFIGELRSHGVESVEAGCCWSLTGPEGRAESMSSLG